jgi:hypothetical protein
MEKQRGVVHVPLNQQLEISNRQFLMSAFFVDEFFVVLGGEKAVEFAGIF